MILSYEKRILRADDGCPSRGYRTVIAMARMAVCGTAEGVRYRRTSACPGDPKILPRLSQAGPK